MYCKNCGNFLSDDATSCNYCGCATQGTNMTGAGSTEQYSYVNNNQNNMSVLSQKNTGYAGTKENVITGIIGALIGAIIGGAVIILLSRIGLVASISGWILAICAIKGYQLLGKGFSIKGMIICLILIVITPYLANKLDWALYVREAYDNEIGLGRAISLLSNMMSFDSQLKAQYIKSLLMIYLFAGIGGISTILGVFKQK